MPKIALLTLDGCYASSLFGLVDLCQVANAHLRRQMTDNPSSFQWKFVSLSQKAVAASGGITLSAEPLSELNEKFDVIYIPGLFYTGRSDFQRFLEKNRALRDWATRQWAAGAVIAANCTGTFVLAEFGLLDGRSATTTWWLERQFRERYPGVKLDTRQLMTDVDRLMCAGGALTYQHLGLRIVERFCTQAIASLCSQTLLVGAGQMAQMPYVPLVGVRDHGDALVSRAQYKLQQDLRQPLSMSALADSLAVSQRTLIRRFKAALGIGPLTYLQNLRIEGAKQLLGATDLNVDTIIHEVGYADSSSFSRMFHERTGITPSGYRDYFRHVHSPVASRLEGD